MTEARSCNDDRGAWGWPALSRKAHYFHQGRSLCGRWAYSGAPTNDQRPGSADDCKECLRKLTARVTTPAPVLPGRGRGGKA